MDLKSPEQPIDNELPEQKEVVVPPEIAHAFGRELKQKTQVLLDIIKEQNTILEVYLASSKEKKIIRQLGEGIAGSLDDFSGKLRGLETAKEAKLVMVSNGWDFDLKGQEKDISIPQGSITMGKELTSKFILALRHTYGHTFGSASGNFSTIARYAKNNKVKEQAEEAYKASSELNRTIDKLLRPDGVHDACGFEITTNGDGETTIAPITNSKPNGISRP